MSACTPQKMKTCLTFESERLSRVQTRSGTEQRGRRIRGWSVQRTSKRRLYESARITACRGASSTLSPFCERQYEVERVVVHLAIEASSVQAG